MADSNSNFVNPYERIWKTRDLRQLEPKPIELENNLSSFERGLGRFGQQMKGTGYGLAALASQGVQNVIGENPVTQGITDWGLQGYNEAMAKSQPGAYYAPKIASVEDIKSLSDAWEWGTGMLGEQLPLAASLMLTGGVGGAVARLGANAAVKDIAKAAIGTAVKKGVEQGVLKAAEGQLVTGAMRNAASKALLDTTLKGAAVTGFMGTAGLEGGLSFGETVQGGAAPADAVKTAIAVGGINGALELLTPFVIAKRMGMGEYAKNSIKEIIKTSPDLSKRAVAIAKELGTRGAKGFAEGAVTEGITEGLQELTSIAGERWAKNDPLFADLTEQDWSRIKNASAGGLFVGGVLSGAGATLSGPQQAGPQAQPPAATPPAAQPPATTPSQTRAQALDSLRARVDTELEAAQKRGDTKRVQELQEARDIIVANQERIVEEAPIQEAPTQEAPAQEPLVQEPLVQELIAPVVPAPGETAPSPIQEISAQETPTKIPSVDFDEQGIFEHTFTENEIPTVAVSGRYDEEQKELYIKRIDKNPNLRERKGLGIEALQSLIADAESQGKPVDKVTAEASESFVKSLKRSPFADRLTVTDIPGIKEKDVVIDLKPSKLTQPAEETDLREPGQVAPGAQPTGQGAQDQVTPPSPVVPVPGESTETPTTAGAIKKGFSALGNAANYGALKKVAADILSGAPVVYGNPAAIASAKANPNYNVEDTADGKVRVIGVLDPDTGNWVGQSPTTLQAQTEAEVKSGTPPLQSRALQRPEVRDATPLFNKTEIERQKEPSFKSRDKLISMPISDFLQMAEPIERGEDTVKRQDVEKLIREGKEFSDLPFLQVRNNGAKGATVVGHEGRHRALALQRAGYTHMPVLLAIQPGKGLGIRWSEQQDPQKFDYVPEGEWPSKLIAENKKAEIAFPVSREQATRAYGTQEASVEITPAMRDSVMQGQPLFSKSLRTTPEFKRWSREYPVVENAKADESAFIPNYDLKGVQLLKDLSSQLYNENTILLDFIKENGAPGKILNELNALPKEGFEAEKKVIDDRYLKSSTFISEQSEKIKAIEKQIKEIEEWLKYKYGDGPVPAIVSNDNYVNTNFTFETGKPFVAKVYHGSKTNTIGEFDTDKLGSYTGAPSARKGFFFAGNPETTEAYAGTPLDIKNIKVEFDGVPYDQNTLTFGDPKKIALTVLHMKAVKDFETNANNITKADKNRLIEETLAELRHSQEQNDLFAAEFSNEEENAEDEFSGTLFADTSSGDAANWLEQNKDAVVLESVPSEKSRQPTTYPVYVRMSNPMVYDQKGVEYRETTYNDLLKQARDNEHDGLVILNTYDGGPLDNIFVVFDNKNIKGYFNKGTFDETGRLLESKQPDIANIPLQDFHSNINSIMGEGWLQQAIDAGLVEVIEGKGPNGEAGSWTGDRIRLYTGSMPKDGSPAGVLLHEGKHATFKDILGDSLSAYVKDLHVLAKNGNKVAQDAITHAVIAAADSMGIKHNLYDGGTKADFDAVRALIEEKYPGLLAEEELAYFVQHGTEAQTGQGFLRRLINAIKAWLMQTRLGQRAKELGIGFELTDGMAVEWAKMGLNRSLQELKQAAKVRAQVEKQAATLPASARLGKALGALEDFDPLYSFAGVGTLTANLDLLAEAELRIKNGEDKESVRQDTGWFLNEADGKWRFEISDKEASFKTPFKDIPESELFGRKVILALSEVLDHPRLFEAYPAIRNIGVIKQTGLQSGLQGWFDSDNLQIGIAPNATNPFSTLLHEVQHVIQMYEGFAKGGNANSVWDYVSKEDKLKIARDALEKNNKKLKEAQDKLDVITVFEESPDVIRNYAEARRDETASSIAFDNTADRYTERKQANYERWIADLNKLNEAEAILLDKLGRSDLKHVFELPLYSYKVLNDIINSGLKDFTAYKLNLNQEIVDLYQKATKIKSGDDKTIRDLADLHTFYKRLAGETEARLTQARQGMTRKERISKSPESMQEYPYNEQIVVMPGTKTSGEVFYSMGIQELRQRLWTDPTDVNQDLVNKPGLLQRFRGNFIDFFAEMEKKSKDIYDTYSLLRSKKAGRIEQARQEYYFPLRELIAKSPWSAKEMGDMLAARHIKVDKVNTRLAERASYGFTKDLLKALPKTKQKELQQARVNIKAGRMPDGSDYVDANGNKIVMAATTKQKLMFDLMNKYAQHEIADTNGRQVLREEWELFKDAAGGFSNGGVGKNKVRTVDDVLQMADRDRAKFDEIANLFDALNRHTLDILEEGGLITAKEHARLLADKSAYAPLRRESYNVNREIELLFQKAGQGGSKQISTRTGTAALSEPALVLQNALAATEAAAAAAERNLANKELYKVIVADREGWKPWFTIVEKDKYVTHDEDGFLQEKHATASNRADITLINDGKKLVIRPNMHNERAMGFVRAVNNLDAQILSGPMQVLGWVNQIVRWVNVSASPVFLMMNMVRDPFTALYNIQASKAGEYTKEIFSPKTYKDSFRALKKVFMDGNRDPNDPDVQLVEEWELAGGRTSFVETLREMDDTWRSFDAQVARRQGNMKQLMQAKDKWIDGIENLNILFENVMRFSTYKVLREHQVSKKEAARISQDLTTNFTRRGYKTQMLGTWWLFFNATVQGNYQVLRNLMGSKKVQAMVGGTMVMALLLDLLGRAIDDDWDKIPEWDKERFIILPVKVGGDFVRIPAPWVYNVVWRTGGLFGEALAQVKKPQDAVLDIAAMVASVFNPLGKPGSIAQAIAPTAADPFVQILENKDFAGNPLGPEGFPGAGSKANSELLWSSTPKGYQSIARWVNEFTGGSAVESGMIDLRPADYQLLARFLTGSLGRFMSDATFGVKEALDKGIEGPRDIPVVKEIFSDPYDPLKSQKYHTNIAGIYGAHKLEQMYLRGPDRDLIKLQEVRKNRGEELRMYSQAQDVERQLKSLRVRLRAAQNREDREREKEIKDRMGKIQERFNERYQQRMG